MADARQEQGVVATRNLPKTLTVLGIVGAILASLFSIRVDFKLHARGTLEPVEKRNMFAPLDGRVVQISDQARQGQIVQAGQPLLRLESLELAGELEQLEGNVNATIEKVYSLTQQRSKLKDRTEVARVEGEILEQEKLLAGYEESLKVARVKEKQLIVHSPITAEILTWLPLDKLNGRPVQTGQVLLTVADPTKDWDLEILMAEDRMGHILRAVREQRTRRAGSRIRCTDRPQRNLSRDDQEHPSHCRSTWRRGQRSADSGQS